MVASISTNCVSEVEDDRYLELLVNFYPCRSSIDKNPMKFSNCKLVLPKDWWPRMYLDAINWLIMNNSILSINSITLSGHIYVTINELHWLLSSPVDVINMQLTSLAVYLYVAGGKYQTNPLNCYTYFNIKMNV